MIFPKGNFVDTIWCLYYARTPSELNLLRFSIRYPIQCFERLFREPFFMSEIQLSDQNFDAEVMQAQEPVLVDFWAPWCGPCRMLAPMIVELAEEYSGRAKICKLNTDDNPDVASRFQISAIPALLFFKGGKLVDQLTGVRPKPEIKSTLEKLFSPNLSS